MAAAAADVEVARRPAPCTLEELRRRARPVLRAARVHRAVAFGSWARGEADGFSDLDLLVVADTSLARAERGLVLAAQLDEALPVVVDLIVCTPMEFARGEARGMDVIRRDRPGGDRHLRARALAVRDAEEAGRWLATARSELGGNSPEGAE